MAVPTISSVVPSLGHTGGRTLVAIVGTGFALPGTPAPANAPIPAGPPTVSVTVGGVAATDVVVVSATLLYCSTPPAPLDSTGAAELGPHAVVVQNLDTNGAPISGELATEAAAFMYQRPDLTQEGELARVIRTLIQELKRQIHPNVVFSTHTDFDDAGDLMNYTTVQSMPALILGQVTIEDNLRQGTQEPPNFEAAPGLFIERRAPNTVDIGATLVGATDSSITALNLQEAVRAMFKKTPWLVVLRDPNNASLGSVRYELDWKMGVPVAVTHAADGSNVESFAGQITVRGVLLEDMPGISTTKPAEIPSHFPHEATTSIGAVTLDVDAAVDLTLQRKT